MNREQALQWLVGNVKNWPKSWPDTKDIKHEGWEWYRGFDRSFLFGPFFSDFKHINKEDWKASQPAPASNDDGWIEHKGGECPVDYDVKVEILLASGSKGSATAGYLAWDTCGNGTIIKYRIINEPSSNKPSWDDAPEDLSEELESMNIDGVEYIAGKAGGVLPNVPMGGEWNKPKLVSTTNKYNKPCKGITIDVYDVLKAFEVTCPAMQHAIKKCLMAGKRGAKDAVQDMNEAIQSIERSKELLDQ